MTKTNVQPTPSNSQHYDTPRKFWVNCMATLKHIASVARTSALFNHKPHICDIQFDVVANDLNNRIVIKIRTTPPSKRT